MDNDAENHEKIKFLVRIGDGELNEIILCNEISSIFEDQQERQAHTSDTTWIFKSIKNHQGPLSFTHTDYKGSSYNVLVEWEDGSGTNHQGRSSFGRKLRLRK
jgi:hypothetical protein